MQSHPYTYGVERLCGKFVYRTQYHSMFYDFVSPVELTHEELDNFIQAKIEEFLTYQQ